MDEKDGPMSFNEAVKKASSSIHRFPLIEVRGVPLRNWIAQNWSSVWAFCPDPSDLLISTYPKAGWSEWDVSDRKTMQTQKVTVHHYAKATHGLYQRDMNIKKNSDDSSSKGTTWVQEIVDLLLHGGDDEVCKRAPTAARIPFLEVHYPPPIPSGLDLLKTMKSPRVIKTHLPIQLVPEGFWENKCKVIYVARNAKDNLVSYYHFDRMNLIHPEPGSWEEYVQKFMKGKLAWGSWYNHVKGYWKERKKRNILYIFFEDMKENPRREIVRIMRYLDLSLSDDIIDKIVELTSFNVMKDNPMANYISVPKIIFDHSISAFMRKGEVGDWTNYFTPAQSQMFDEDYARQMADVDIPFRISI